MLSNVTRFRAIALCTVLALPGAAGAEETGTVRVRAKPSATRAAVESAPLWWFTIGANLTAVQDDEKRCFGPQIGLSWAGPVLVRVQHSVISFESDDDTDTCDRVLLGDTTAAETALTAGLALGDTGLFAAAGPARVDVETAERGAWGQDTGTRYEIGWTSRWSWGSTAGVEAVVFRDINDVRNFTGFAINATFGQRRD